MADRPDVEAHKQEEYFTRAEWEAEARAFKAETRLLVVAAIIAGPVVSNLPLGATQAGFAGISVAAVIAVKLWRITG